MEDFIKEQPPSFLLVLLLLTEKNCAKTQKKGKIPKNTTNNNSTIKNINEEEHIFKKPKNVREYTMSKSNAVITQKQKSESRMVMSPEHKMNLDSDDFLDINDIDIHNLPVVFDENFGVQEFIEIPAETGHMSAENIGEISGPKENEENKKYTNTIKIISDEIIKAKEKGYINIEKMKRDVLKDSNNTKHKLNYKKYYTKDEDILRELMEDD